MLRFGLRNSLYVVRGASMEPSFFDGDVLLVAGPQRKPCLGDIVIVRLPDDAGAGWQVKRIVGLAGDRIAFECGLLYINGAHHREPYLGGLPADLGARSRSWRVGSGECMVMGDNRARSTDSREFGPIPLTSLTAVVVMRLWPIGRRRRS